MYNDLVVTSKRYMRELSSIKPEWIFEVASHHFTDRRKEIHQEQYIQAATKEVAVKKEDQFAQEFNVRLGKRLHKQTGLIANRIVQTVQTKKIGLSFADEEDC